MLNNLERKEESRPNRKSLQETVQQEVTGAENRLKESVLTNNVGSCFCVFFNCKEKLSRNNQQPVSASQQQ